MAVLKINKDNFEKEVLNSTKPVLIDFWATWCAPCMMMSPVVDEIGEEFEQYKICKINVDQEPELANRFKIMQIPNFIIINNGKILDQKIGMCSKEDLLNLLLI